MVSGEYYIALGITKLDADYEKVESLDTEKILLIFMREFTLYKIFLLYME